VPFSQDDKALIKNTYLFKGYCSRRLLAEFPDKNWARRGIDKLLRTLRETGSTDWQHGIAADHRARALERTWPQWRSWH